MRKNKVLIVEDELSFQQNYKELLAQLDVEVEAVSTAADALLSLYKKHYNVVLLDLSLDPNNQYDRTSHDVQKHLTNQTDGTQYMIVSRTAEKEDVREAAYKFKAFDVIFKAELAGMASILNEKVLHALEKSLKIEKEIDLIGRSYPLLYEGISANKWEFEILSTLKQKGDFLDIKNFFSKYFLDFLAPIVNHKTKTHLVAFPENGCVLGLLWSRQLGKPVSICIFNTAVSRTDEDARALLNNWQGWMPGVKLADLNKDSIVAKVFSEDEHIEFNEFMLLQP